jgi:hypothetical protein
VSENPLPCDLRDARRHLPGAADHEVETFARRQLRARQRLGRMLAFYDRYPCRMARLKLLAACAITLGRFCGYSAAYEAIAEGAMPCDHEGRPRTPAWAEYVEACERNRPWVVRDELWLNAYMLDIQKVVEGRVEELFLGEAERHPHDPTWRLLRRHLEVTVGARVIDAEALEGVVAGETAMARTMARGFGRLFLAGWSLLGYYLTTGCREVFTSRGEPRRPLLTYRQCVLRLLRLSATAFTAYHVYRRGIRQRDRGRLTSEEGWPLLAEVLRERVNEVHPLVVRFYTNPSQFETKVILKLHTVPAVFWSRLSAMLLGQGLYEAGPEEIEARFRVFRRDDGSMHFLRELYCNGVYRLFDSDFLVRATPRGPALFERFADLHTDVEMDLCPLTGGGLQIRSRAIYLHGIRLPSLGFYVEFRSHVGADEKGDEVLRSDGRLLLQPRTRWGRFWAYAVLRRPPCLGSIHYLARPRDEARRETVQQAVMAAGW